MLIEEGKFYLTRDGRKVGPMHLSGDDVYRWKGAVSLGESHHVWCEGGRWNRSGFDHIRDLIAPWEDGPTPAPDPDPRDAEIERLRAALKEAREVVIPLADLSDYIDEETEGLSDDDHLDIQVNGQYLETWYVSIVRRARAILSTIDAALTSTEGTDNG